MRIQRDRHPKSGQDPAPDGAARIHDVVPVHATRKTLREALWFEVNPPLKDSAQETLSLSGLCERLKTLFRVKTSHPF